MTTIVGAETVEAAWSTGTRKKVRKIKARTQLMMIIEHRKCLQVEGGEGGEGDGGRRTETRTMTNSMDSMDRYGINLYGLRLYCLVILFHKVPLKCIY